MTLTDAPNRNALWARVIVEELSRNGVEMFCLSPGSRCAPLTCAVADNPRARSMMHFDERGAAFYALGCAKATEKPVALISTSGTAVANYLPAVVEASQSRVPLILLTADRPPELQDTGANQTIRQPGIFSHFVRWEFELPCPSPEISLQALLSTVDQLCYRARRSPAGPVHLNCRFREPLAPTPHDYDARLNSPALGAWLKSARPYTQYAIPRGELDADTLDAVSNKLNSAQRGALVVGMLSTTQDRAAVVSLARKLGWPVLPDVTSGLRLGSLDAPCVHYYDQALLSKTWGERFRPDAVLYIGGAVTSKRLAEHLAAYPPEVYINVAGHPQRCDPAHQVTLRIEADIASFCEQIGAVVRAASREWAYSLLDASEKLEKAIEAEISAGPLGDTAVARMVSQMIPAGHALYLGNSMPIRDMDMYGKMWHSRPRLCSVHESDLYSSNEDSRGRLCHNSPAGPAVFANRGASGIDGQVATAAGLSHAGPVTAIAGDLGLLHDLNSLALLKQAPTPVTLIVLNNNGGGIFHFLPIAEYGSYFEPYFGTPHDLNFHAAAHMFGLRYEQPATLDDFKTSYAASVASHKPTLIEVITCRDENFEAHQALQRRICEALEDR